MSDKTDEFPTTILQRYRIEAEDGYSIGRYEDNEGDWVYFEDAAKALTIQTAELAEVRKILGETINARNCYQWECERLQAELAVLREQKPVAWSYKERIWVQGIGGSVWSEKLEKERPDTNEAEIKDLAPLYAAPLVSDKAGASGEPLAWLVVGVNPKHRHPHKAVEFSAKTAEGQAAHWRNRGCTVEVTSLAALNQLAADVAQGGQNSEALLPTARKVEALREAFEQRYHLDIWSVVDWLRNVGLPLSRPVAADVVQEGSLFDQWLAPRKAATWPDDWKRHGFNYAFQTASEALRYLANNDRPIGGETRYNAEHLFQIASEIETSVAELLPATRQEGSKV